MALARELQSQFSAQAVAGIQGSGALTVTAAGTTQATATALAAQYNVITTAGVSGAPFAGVLLPGSMGGGDDIDVANQTSVNICVYPPVGFKLNNQTANMPLTMAPNRMHTFVCIDGNNYTVDCI